MDIYGSNPTLIVLESIALWNGLICVCLSLFLNLFLILSIIRYSPPHMGMYYRIVQSLLSLCSIVLVSLVVLTRPTMHAHSGIFIFSAQPPFPISRSPLIIFIFTFLFFFVQNKGILSTLMVYRILCMRLGNHHHLHPLLILSLPTISLLISLPITVLLVIVLIPWNEKTQRCIVSADSSSCLTVGQSIQRHLSPDSTFILSTISEGENRNWWFITAMILLVILLLSASIVINVGAKKITTHANRARDSLQRQLARALYAQSLVPSILVQIPIGIGVVGTLFNQDMDLFFHFLPIVSAWYTVADPLIIFHNVRIDRRYSECCVFPVGRMEYLQWEQVTSKGRVQLVNRLVPYTPSLLSRPIQFTGENRVIRLREGSSSVEPRGPSPSLKEISRTEHNPQINVHSLL